MIRIEALPAEDGDCLWVEWDHLGGMRRMLVDGGRSTRDKLPAGLAERFARQPRDQRYFDLVVCTHIDIDHIGGLLALFAQPPDGFAVGDVWFNGRPQLRSDLLGPAHGDELSDLLGTRSVPWNRIFGGSAAVVTSQPALPAVRLPGLTITLLSPTWNRLDGLARVWPAVTRQLRTAEPEQTDILGDRDAGLALRDLARAPYVADRSAANGSSIAFVAEDASGHRVLLGADAHAEVLVSSLRQLGPERRYRVDICKAPHHASAHNVSPELVDALECQHWLVSTSGARHSHPSRRAIARILARGSDNVLWFNYRSPTTEQFAPARLRSEYGYQVRYPDYPESGVVAIADADGIHRGDAV
jgi:Metallo-beta-lactamase superfamily